MAFKALQRTNPSTNVFGVVGMYIDQASIQKMREWDAAYGGQDLGNEMVMGRDFEVRDGRLFFYRSWDAGEMFMRQWTRSEEHTSELQSRENLVCRLLLEKKKKKLYKNVENKVTK